MSGCQLEEGIEGTVSIPMAVVVLEAVVVLLDCLAGQEFREVLESLGWVCLLACVMVEESHVVCVLDAGHGHKDGSKFHLEPGRGATGKGQDDTGDGASLGLVNGHGKGQIKGHRILGLHL